MKKIEIEKVNCSSLEFAIFAMENNLTIDYIKELLNERTKAYERYCELTNEMELYVYFVVKEISKNRKEEISKELIELTSKYTFFRNLRTNSR